MRSTRAARAPAATGTRGRSVPRRRQRLTEALDEPARQRARGRDGHLLAEDGPHRRARRRRRCPAGASPHRRAADRAPRRSPAAAASRSSQRRTAAISFALAGASAARSADAPRVARDERRLEPARRVADDAGAHACAARALADLPRRRDRPLREEAQEPAVSYGAR
jgi:hypothetical protein